MKLKKKLSLEDEARRNIRDLVHDWASYTLNLSLKHEQALRQTYIYIKTPIHKHSPSTTGKT